MKRSDNLSWSQVKTGIFIVVALLLLAGGILLMGDKTKMFVPKEQLSLIMRDVAGLKVGAPVWLAGVDVGLVREIHFDQPTQNNEVEIILEVERGALKKIGKDSVITIKTRGLMGEKYVDITPSQFYTSRITSSCGSFMLAGGPSGTFVLLARSVGLVGSGRRLDISSHG